MTCIARNCLRSVLWIISNCQHHGHCQHHYHCYLCLQVVRTFFATLNAFSHATVGSDATDGDLFGAYDAVQHYMKFICMPKLSTSHLGSVCHASNHGTQVGLVSMRHMVILCL